MTLNDLKERAQAGKAPSGSEPESTGVAGSGAGLIAELKAADEMHVAMLRRARLFLVVATGIFIVAFLATWLSAETSAGPGGLRLFQLGGLAVIYIFVSLLYAFRLRQLSRIDHSQPVLAFLAEAEARYTFLRPSDWLLIVFGLPFVGALSGAGSIPYLSRIMKFADAYWPMTYYYAAFILVVAGFGLYFTRKNWAKDRAPLLRQIREARHELESAV